MILLHHRRKNVESRWAVAELNQTAMYYPEFVVLEWPASLNRQHSVFLLLKGRCFVV